MIILLLPLEFLGMCFVFYKVISYDSKATCDIATCDDKQKKFGDAGYRSPYLSHAKRALYHLSYVPIVLAVLFLSNANTKSTVPAFWICHAHLFACTPSIAQLVERWTVVVNSQVSIGRWFKSGSKDFCHTFWPYDGNADPAYPLTLSIPR